MQELEYYTYLATEPFNSSNTHAIIIDVDNLQYVFSSTPLKHPLLEYYGKTTQQELDLFNATTQAQFKFNVNDIVGYTLYKQMPFILTQILDNNYYHIKSQDPRFKLEFQVQGTDLYKLDTEPLANPHPIQQQYSKTLAIDCNSINLNLSTLAIIKAIFYDYKIILFNYRGQELDYLENYNCANLPYKPSLLLTNYSYLANYYKTIHSHSFIKDLNLFSSTPLKSNYLQQWIQQ